jgi:DNA gyrase subunit A
LVARLGEIEVALRGDAEQALNGDRPWVLLSSAGLIGRWENFEVPPQAGPRTTHDVIVSAVRSADVFGVLTSRGRVVRARVADLPVVAVDQVVPNLQGGQRATDLLGLEAGEHALSLTTLNARTFGWALGTRKGVVKRTNPELPRGDEPFEIIRLEDGDEVVGAVELPHERRQLVFITSDGQLLHYPATSVRPQGRSGGGMAGIKLDQDARVVFFGSGSLTGDLVVSNAGRKSARDSDFAGSLKITPLSAFPEKGRATGGVRCHRFLKGEDVLYLAWSGPAPAIAATKTGSPSNLPAPEPRRDGSGTPATLRIAAVGSRVLGSS